MYSELDPIIEFLRAQPVFTLFLVLGCGCLVGNIRIAGIGLSAVAGTLLVAIVLGRFGFRISPAAQSVGFAMFIFAVGHQAGPRFVEVIRTDGLRYLALAVVVSLIGVGAALIAGHLLELPPGGTAGLMAGALTTTPALAAAQNAVRDGIANLPAGTDPEQVIATIGTSYAITYVVGMFGMILAVKLLPRLAGFDLALEARKAERATAAQPPQLQPDDEPRTYGEARLVVARREIAGTTLADLRLAQRYGLVVVGIRRDGLALPLHQDLLLQRGDVISVVGPPRDVAALARQVGPVEAAVNETDMKAFAFGIAAGSLLGLLSINVAGVPLGLGSAGGLLLAGIVTGWLSSNRPSVGRFPDAARWILMEFGLLLFICGVGLQAGSDIVETFRQTGWSLVVAAVVVVTLPLVGGYFFAGRVLKLNPIVLMGALTGAMTSGPALRLVTDETKSAVPALGYSGTYAFASILLAISGTIVMLIP